MPAPIPTVFLSFASEDVPWKTNFVNRAWFGDILGIVETVDYQNGDALAFGRIRTCLQLSRMIAATNWTAARKFRASLS